MKKEDESVFIANADFLAYENLPIIYDKEDFNLTGEYHIMVLGVDASYYTLLTKVTYKTPTDEEGEETN